MSSVQPAFEITQPESMQWNRTCMNYVPEDKDSVQPIDPELIAKVRRLLSTTTDNNSDPLA